MRKLFGLILMCVWSVGAEAPPTEVSKLPKTEEEWQKRLTPEQFRTLCRSETEKPFTGALLRETRDGHYLCAGCGNQIFASSTKFDSGSGWPSFFRPLQEKAVGTREDRSLGMVRTEVHCGVCKGHLGHVFADGPQPTGLRYCINSSAMTFKPSEAEKK